MNRKEFFEKSMKFGLCSCALTMVGPFSGDSLPGAENSTAPTDKTLEQLNNEKIFIQNWLSDLLDTMDKVLDEKTKIKLIEGCGRGCFNRHQFKKNIAEKGKGNIDKLIEAYNENFEIWREGHDVHLRYGKVSKACYCPAAKSQPVKPNDLLCECTRMTHQSIFETALDREIKVEVLESLRRGGKTCHFLVQL
ncbi:MAG: hypothetical protein MUF15_10585 [Acidobacteria bacterium]|jgi:hypothetical protein|nr:hypothetical protein [Acidobacteriota bacterium]